MRTLQLAAVAVALLSGCAPTTTVTASDPTAAAPPAPGTPTTALHPPAPTAATTGTAPSHPAAALSTSSTATPSPVVSYGRVDRSNPTAVAVALLEATFTSNTATDTNPQAAVDRSLRWYTPARAAAIRSEAPSGPPGAEWTSWTAHHALTTVTVTTDHDPGAPIDTATRAYRQFEVKVTPHGSNGWTAPPDVYECFVVLTRPTAHAPWQAQSLETDQ